MAKNILLTISYDGTDFCGWQRQDSQRSVQGDLESALEKLKRSAAEAQALLDQNGGQK